LLLPLNDLRGVQFKLLAQFRQSLVFSQCGQSHFGLELGIEFTLIFTHITLRRIFSRGSLKKGGRFYGGWWENIPSKFRPYLTINGFATGEVDFSELHPRLLYLLNNQPVPTGDLYDDGWRSPEFPEYNAKLEP